MSVINKVLSPDDAAILNESSDINWVPKEPQEVILPYVPEEIRASEEETDLDMRRRKAKEVIDGYGEIINECKIIEAQIEQKCKDVKVPLTRAKNLRVIEALARVFGLGEIDYITFDMYKVCIKELAKLSNDTGAPE